MTYPCPTCGYPLEAPVEDSDICPSCGTQFGYSDSGRTYSQLRENWVQHGAPWHSRVERVPRGWNPWLQLIRAGYEYAVPSFRFEVRGVALSSYVQKELNEKPRPVYV